VSPAGARHAAPCPSCGAEVVFGLGASLLKVCGHCGVAVARKGADLASYGKVADLVATGSVLKLGLKGDYEGAPPFTLAGRLQLDYGQGAWDEWLMAFRNDRFAWLSESQGKFHYLGEVKLPPLPRFDAVQVGQTLDLGPPGTFVVTELREARFASAEGELPFAVEPGSVLHYADLSGPGGQFGTIDYGTGVEPEALYVGREVALEELGLVGLRKPEEVRKAARAESLSCPQCGGPLEVRAPDQTQRIACPYCGSLLDATQDLKVLEVMTKVPVKPLIPLGAKGRLRGAEWTVIGFMERSVTVEGMRYPWREYLLHEAKRGFRWLTESKGHWSFVEPVNPGDVTHSFGRPQYAGTTFKHFQGGIATVDHVVGEFYWAVSRGEKNDSQDYVAPPLMLSRETTRSETTFSLATYEEVATVWKAFGLTGQPPERGGIAPNQPWPWAESARGLFSNAFLLAIAVVVVFGALRVAAARTVYTQEVTLPESALSGAQESAIFTERFTVPRSGNLEIRVQAPVANSWLYLEGALINEQTGRVDEFDTEVSYYYGSDSDGSWSEGGQTAFRYIGRVPAGEYVMRLQPQWEGNQRPSRYQVTVRNGVARVYQALLALLAIAAWPAIVAWRKFRFEMERWSESDHPWVTSESD
jgi:hypothetical protein